LLHPAESRGVAFLSGPAKVTPEGDNWGRNDAEFRFVHKAVEPAVIGDAGTFFVRTNRREKRYVSMNRFRGWPCEAQLLELNATYVDLDYYNTTLKDAAPEQVLFLCLLRCEDAGIPEPSMATFSGRGLLLLWLHSPMPPAALPRWHAIQDRLQEVFHGLGVDRSGRTCTKIFRIPGSANRGATVRVIHPTTRAAVVRWDFEDLALEMLPVPRQECKKAPAKKKPRKPGGKAGPQGKTARKTSATDKARERSGAEKRGYQFEGFWRAVEAEVDRLRRHRYGDGYVREGERDLFIFIYSACAARLLPVAELKPWVEEVCRRVAGWGKREARSVACSVIRRAEKAARGEKIEWNGKLIDPRYRMSGATVARFLNVTAKEARDLNLAYVAPEDVKAERRRAAVRKCRQKKGVVDQKERRAQRQRHAAEIAKMRAEKRSFREIGETLGLPVSTVHAIHREFPLTEHTTNAVRSENATPYGAPYYGFQGMLSGEG
jgi:hypothetical protein